MAEEEHVALLKQGVVAWNSWRMDSSRAPALRTADLSGADLSGANLFWVNFSEANLSGVDFSGAILASAALTEANLSEANLSRAHIFWANLTKANLSGANLNNARLYETVFGNTDLKDTHGLETCRHSGPSTIDHRTLERSGPLPLAFLRGCGLPDNLIDYPPALLEQAIQFYSCFISYSSQDDAFARRLHADLQDKGVRCWFAPEDLKIGDKILDTIDLIIPLHDKLLLILSKNAIASDWVEDEVTKAFAEERSRKQTVLFPIRVDNAVMDAREAWAVKLKDNRNIGDFTRWKEHDAYQSSLERLLRDLKVVQEGQQKDS